jgi:hypothetical protein
MIRPGNTKLGSLIHQWSIPSAIRKICIGATLLCLALCYAAQGHYRQGNVKQALARNYDLSRRNGFIAAICMWLNSLFVRVLRIHASGEFYSAAYAQKWITIVKRNPKVFFYAYTRSWRDPDVLPRLVELAALNNFQLWFSCDRETGAPPLIPGILRAYLMVDDNDIPAFEVDLIFRDNKKTVLKKVNDVLVCPPENGVTDLTCSQCQYCFRTKRRQNDANLYHISVSGVRGKKNISVQGKRLGRFCQQKKTSTGNLSKLVKGRPRASVDASLR